MDKGLSSCIDNSELLNLKERLAIVEKALVNSETSDRLTIVEAKIQTSIDLTDDIVGMSGNLLSTIEGRVNNTLVHADMVLEHSDDLVSVYLVIIGFFVALAGMGISWILGKRQEEQIRKSVGHITDKLKKDDEFRKEFIQLIISDENVRENIFFAINEIVTEELGSSRADAKKMGRNLEFE